MSYTWACFCRAMRFLWLACVVAACGPAVVDPCSYTACPSGWTCVVNGTYGECKQPTTGGSGGGGGGVVVKDAGAGGGMGGGAGGSMAPQKVFVSLTWEEARCCYSCPSCLGCSIDSCKVTNQLEKATFDRLRASAFGACAVTQTASDGYSVTCNNCTLSDSTCRMNNMNYSDKKATCTNITGTGPGLCQWSPF